MYQIKHYFDFSNCKFTLNFLISAIWRGLPCRRSSDNANTDWVHCLSLRCRVKWQTVLPAIWSQRRHDVRCATATVATDANIVTMSPDVTLLAGYCFSRSSIKFWGHTGQKFADFDPNCALNQWPVCIELHYTVTLVCSLFHQYPTALILTLLMLEIEYSGFGDQYHACWCTGFSSPQCISRHVTGCVEQKLCIFAPKLISTIWVKPNPRYDSKYECVFYYL